MIGLAAVLALLAVDVAGAMIAHRVKWGEWNHSAAVAAEQENQQMNETQTRLTIQDLQLELMRRASFNSFDGDHVADSLLDNRDLWRGAIFDRAAYFTLGAYNDGRKCDPIDNIRLRDIGDGYWNADTLYLTPAEDEGALEALARTWHADEIDWQDFPNAGRALRVWWD